MWSTFVWFRLNVIIFWNQEMRNLLSFAWLNWKLYEHTFFKIGFA